MKDFHYYNILKYVKCEYCKVDYFQNPVTIKYHRSKKCLENKKVE